jgi:hypothetical protein
LTATPLALAASSISLSASCPAGGDEADHGEKHEPGGDEVPQGPPAWSSGGPKLNGRTLGSQIGSLARTKAQTYFNGTAS